MIGTKLAHYKITEKLGHGGMGEVYLAEDTRLKRQVALKVVSVDLAGDPDRLARFQREAETVAGLNHPNIVTLYSVESEDDIHFITMELVEGKTLDEVIPSDGLALNRVFELAIPFADALSAAHEKGIIHRDLKPANVMLNDEGRLKVLDFGLAKPLEESGSGQEATQLLTEEGKVLGTVPYMAPEQVKGLALDRRSDIFSMGVMLYEMATGSRPFQGDTSAELISSILRDQPVAVTEVKVDLPHHLGRIIRHCLEKDPKRRYQSALDIRNELEALRKEVESGVIMSESAIRPIPTGSLPAASAVDSAAAEAVGASKKSWLKQAAVALAIVAVALISLKALDKDDDSGGLGDKSVAVAIDPDQPAIVVLFFDNLSGDKELDWLRNGLTDMLVTDLSQSPDLRVLSTNRVYQILSDMKRLDERITSFEVIREVAKQASADTVILGSFAKLGETIRISITIQEASTGEILKSNSVDANAQEDIFARIDDLSRSIRQSIELPEKPALVADRNLTEVSTQSVKAYKSYVEAERLHYETRDFEAIPFYKKAVDDDPEFAMAWAKLSTAHANLQMVAESREYAERAMQHLDRLTEPERAYVEGRYYGRNLETIEKAIETYRSTLDRFPHQTSLSNNLAVLYSNVWLYDEAISAYEQGIRHGDDFPGTFNGLANVYFARGNTDKAFAVLADFIEQNPTNFSAYSAVASFHLALGEIEAAEVALAKGEELQPGWFAFNFVRYSIAVLRADWAEADRLATKLSEVPFPFAKSASFGLRANTLIHQGRSKQALALVPKSIDSWDGPSLSRANSHLAGALAYASAGDPERLLQYAAQAREEGRGNLPDYIAHGLQVLGHQDLGQERRADLILDELTVRLESIPGPAMKHFLFEIRGRLALARGDVERGVGELERAADLLPRFDNNTPRIWFVLGEAYLEAGRPDKAEERFRGILNLHAIRSFSGTEYVESHARLAAILAERGDLEGAREHYQTFVDYWGNGDLARDEIDRAMAFLAET